MMAASSKRVSQPFERVATVEVNVGSFNLGLEQPQIESRHFPKRGLLNFRRIIAKGFEEGDLHLLNLCEVGGHKKGLSASHITAASVVDGVLTKGEYGSHAVQAYMSIWHETGHSHPGGTSVTQKEMLVKDLVSSSACEPQLVVSTYAVKTHGLQAEGILIVGQLHIRTPSGKSVIITTKKRIVHEALGILEKASNSRVLQPTVAILCGDVNLNQDNADACCQPRKGDAMPDVLTQWHTQTSTPALSGDVAFVRGCTSRAFDVTIGSSYKDRGIRNDCHDFFGVTVAVPLFPIPQGKKVQKVRQVTFSVEELSVEDTPKDSEMKVEELSVEDTPKDSEMNSASVSQPSVRHTASLSQPSVPFRDGEEPVLDPWAEARRAGDRRLETPSSPEAEAPRIAPVSPKDSEVNSASVSQPSAREAASAAAQEDSEMKNTASDSQSSVSDTASAAPSTNVGDAIVREMQAWYADRIGDASVATTWKHLHSVLFKKVRVPYAADIWNQSASVSQPSASEADDPVDGIPMVVSEEFVAWQVKKLIERRDKWLRDNNLPLTTLMNEPQKDKFLAELKAEYHGSEDQLRRQGNDIQNGKKVQAGKKQRWSRECQRRGGTTQMFHLLSFSGRWDPSFFAAAPVPQQPGEQSEAQKQATCAAVEARAQVRLARKYDHLKAKKPLHADQLKLVSKLHDGTLEKEAARLTKISGHGRFKRGDGTFISVGGSTGGFTRAVLYNWTPPNLEDEFQ